MVWILGCLDASDLLHHRIVLFRSSPETIEQRFELENLGIQEIEIRSSQQFFGGFGQSTHHVENVVWCLIDDWDRSIEPVDIATLKEVDNSLNNTYKISYRKVLKRLQGGLKIIDPESDCRFRKAVAGKRGLDAHRRFPNAATGIRSVTSASNECKGCRCELLDYECTIRGGIPRDSGDIDALAVGDTSKVSLSGGDDDGAGIRCARDGDAGRKSFRQEDQGATVDR